MERLSGIDLGAHFFFQSLRLAWLDRIAAPLTHAGDGKVLAIVAGLAVITFLVLGHTRAALAFALASCMALGISESVKRLVHRDRPPDVLHPPVEKPRSASFPSGHALGSMAVYGGIGLALSRILKPRRARVAVIAFCFFFAFLIGVTRLYLGVHYLFDVVGGWTAGVACALFGHWVDRIFAPVEPSGPLIFPAPGFNTPVRREGTGVTLPSSREQIQ